jgi:enoyl-CoA hydratase
MPWNIDSQDDIAIVTMNSNKVNKQNPDFFKDIHECFDTLDKEFPRIPVILTGEGNTFSAGLDFEYNFSLFARQDQGEIADWFRDFRKSFLRIFQSPRLTLAAVNGHAFAGGFILALLCDFRIGAKGNARYSINEVPIGVPMPSIYTEIIRYRLGSPAATEAILSGDVYDEEAAIKLGFLQQTTDKDELITAAVTRAQTLPKDCLLAYAQSKKNLQGPVMQTINNDCIKLDEETLKIIAHDESIKAQQRTYKQLLARKR